MDPVSTNIGQAKMTQGDGDEAVADLDTHLGELQMGGGGDMLIDDYDPVDEKPEVAIITPDDSTEEKEPDILANDCKVSRTTVQSNNYISNPMFQMLL